jgi:hypothetical protein
VSVTLRFPRDLYEQAQRHAQQRQTTLTEAVLEGVRGERESGRSSREIKEPSRASLPSLWPVALRIVTG